MQTHFKLGLIGYPLGHSLSPKIHAAALRSCDLKGDYSLFPVAADDMEGLKNFLARVRSGQIHGLNVTIPYKQNVIQFLDELMPNAEAIGAVNTIYLRENKLIGDNTDSPGFLSDLNHFLKRASPATRRSSLVLGAGGSARAVVYGLLNDGWKVSVAARNPAQAEQLAVSFSNTAVQTIDYLSFPFRLQSFDLLVNATPLGMTPNVDQSPLPADTCLPKGLTIYDLVYNPRETKLVSDAQAQGIPAITGLGMLIEQAALAFELWTCHTAPREAMRASVDQSLVSNL
jgi:shikimate dehydrogenase